MTTRYKNVQVYVDPKDHKELKKKLKKLGISLSSWVREKTKDYLKQNKVIGVVVPLSKSARERIKQGKFITPK
jgi:hypothetical protein